MLEPFYVDDVALLAPSPCAFRLMLNRCYQFAQSHSLIFNADKTQLVCFGSAVQCTPNIQFLGHSLEFCSTVQHLGHVLNHDLSEAPTSSIKQKTWLRKPTICSTPFHVVTCSLNLHFSRASASHCLVLLSGPSLVPSSGLRKLSCVRSGVCLVGVTAPHCCSR